MSTRFASRSISLFALGTLLMLAAAPRCPGAPPALAAGKAQGTFLRQEEKGPVTLAYAAAFVDQKDEEKPIVLILSDKKLPTEKWTSEFDLMMAKSDVVFSGIVFFINKEGAAFRCDDYWKSKHESTSGVFELKLDTKGGKELIGTASNSNPKGDAKLEVAFHAMLK